MNWDNLKDHKCPLCSTPFQQGLLDFYIYCQCGFTISQAKYEELMVKMTRPRTVEPVRDNQAELNNLGYEESTDF